MTESRLLLRATVLGMVLALAVGQFGFPGMGFGGGGPAAGGRLPFFGAGGGGGGGGGGRFFPGQQQRVQQFQGGNRFGGGFLPQPPPETTTQAPAPPPVDQKKLVNQIVNAIVKNHEYKMSLEHHNDSGTPGHEPSRAEKIESALWKHNLSP